MDHIPVEPASPDAPSVRPVEAELPEIVTEDPLESLRAELGQLHARGTSGAGWFFWIAGLSLINSIILLSGGDSYFVVGLGVTLVTDSFAGMIAQENPDIAMVVKGAAFGFDLLVAGIVCLFGWLSRRPILPIFALGMVLYLLDGLIYLLVGDWMSVGFHAFVLFGMWSGFTAYREMISMKGLLERKLAAVAQPAAAPLP